MKFSFCSLSHVCAAERKLPSSNSCSVAQGRGESQHLDPQVKAIHRDFSVQKGVFHYIFIITTPCREISPRAVLADAKLSEEVAACGCPFSAPAVRSTRSSLLLPTPNHPTLGFTKVTPGF